MKPNIYDCLSCGHQTITRQVCEGTTPFLLLCTADGCGGMAKSRMFRVPPAAEESATHEFYKPTRAAQRRLSTGMREHVKCGGLCLRRVRR